MRAASSVWKNQTEKPLMRLSIIAATVKLQPTPGSNSAHSSASDGLRQEVHPSLNTWPTRAWAAGAAIIPVVASESEKRALRDEAQAWVAFWRDSQVKDRRIDEETINLVLLRYY